MQSDNTVKEVRNQYGQRVFASLTQSGTFSACTEAHLRVGHTHEDVDGLFSLVTAALRTAPPTTIQTPRDVAKRIHEKLSPMFERRKLLWEVEVMTTVSRYGWVSFCNMCSSN